MYSVKNREDLEKLEELAWLRNQVEETRLQDKLCEKNFHENLAKVTEPVTDIIRNISGNITKTVIITCKESKKVTENLNDNLLEIMVDRGIIASYLLSLLSKITTPENTSHFSLVKVFNSNRVNDLLIHNTIPVTLNNNLLTFRETDTMFELKGGFLKKITTKNDNRDLTSLSDKKMVFDFAKEMYFDVKAPGNKNNWDRSLERLPKSPAIMACGISTMFLPTKPKDFCDNLKLLLQEKEVGNNSDIINKEIVAIIDKFLEDKFISKKQQKQM